MRKLFICLCAALSVFLQPRAQVAQEGASAGESEQQAVRVLDAALDALGGRASLKSVKSFIFKGAGREHRSAEVQGYTPEEQTDAGHEETLVVYPSEERLAFEQRTGRHDGTLRWRRWVYTRDERVVGDFVNRAVYPRHNVATAPERARLARRIPHLLVVEASENASGLRLLSASTLYEGRPHRVIAYSPPGERVTLRLFFDAATHLLSKHEYLLDYPGLGDATAEYTYSSYRRDTRLGWVPSVHSIRLGGRVAREVGALEVLADAPQAGELFRWPDDLTALLAPTGAVVEAADGVYVVRLGSFTLMFVEFRDFVLAVEAPAPGPSLDSTPADAQPGSSSLSETFIRKIKETVPEKPLRYLAVTHFHNDHAGGARAFMAEGSTVLTTPGNRRFFERMAAADYKAVPDRFALNPRGVRIETFDKKRVVTDGSRTVELINVGPNPHTAENVVVYLPAEKFLFQGDLFYFDEAATFPPKDRTTVMSFFARWLRDNRLAPSRIYNVHGRGFATMEHVEQILKMSR